VGPISQQAARHRVPFVASASLQQAITGNKNPYFFRVSRLEGIVQPLCRFLAQTLKARQVAVLYAASPGPLNFPIASRLIFARWAVTPFSGKSFARLAGFFRIPPQVASGQAEVLISGGFYADNLILVRQLRERPWA